MRFLDCLPNHLQSRRDDGKIAYTVILHAERHLNRALTFHYADYQLSKHGSLRIQAVINKLLNDGRLTTDPLREAQWLSCQVVKKMATAVLIDAVEEGTESWDVTIASVFSLVLQAALCSRPGDFKRSAYYAGEEYIKLRDIEMVSTADNDGNVQMRMLVKLLWRKGVK